MIIGLEVLTSGLGLTLTSSKVALETLTSGSGFVLTSVVGFGVLTSGTGFALTSSVVGLEIVELLGLEAEMAAAEDDGLEPAMAEGLVTDELLDLVPVDVFSLLPALMDCTMRFLRTSKLPSDFLPVSNAVLALAAFRLKRCNGTYLSPFSTKTCSTTPRLPCTVCECC